MKPYQKNPGILKVKNDRAEVPGTSKSISKLEKLTTRNANRSLKKSERQDAKRELAAVIPYEVEIISSPVTERYVKPGMTGMVSGDQIQVNGVWHDFDDRWEVKQM